MRQLFFLLGLSIVLSSVGCAIPVGSGPCGGLACDSCGDCDGGGYVAGPLLPFGPLEALRQARRNLVCGGGGCGDVYYGEWRSYPPDCVDPCYGSGACGAAAPCLPGCAPGLLLPRNLVPALYGKRIYQHADGCGCGSCGDCGSGDCGSCGGCSDCGSVLSEGHVHSAPSGGCDCGGHHHISGSTPVSGSTPTMSSPRMSSLQAGSQLTRSAGAPSARTTSPARTAAPVGTATRSMPRPGQSRARTR